MAGHVMVVKKAEDGDNAIATVKVAEAGDHPTMAVKIAVDGDGFARVVKLAAAGDGFSEVVEVVNPEALGPGGIDEFTKLMLNMNTVDFTDSSGEENEPSFPWGTPTVATGDTGFDKCGVFNGAPPTAIKVASPTFNLGAGNWVFDTKVYGMAATYNFLFDYRYATSDLLVLCYALTGGGMGGTDPQWQLMEYEDGWGPRVLWTADQTLSAAAWHHVALVRSGNVVRLMVNGEKVGNDYAFAKTVGAATKFYVGGTDSGSGLAGKMDEFRLSVGTDRDWAGGFTPPASPYTVV